MGNGPAEERDLRRLLAVLRAMHEGNLTIRMPEGQGGIVGELAHLTNVHLNMLRAFAGEVNRVANEIGIIGRLGCQADVDDIAGTWKNVIDSLNQMAGAITCQVRITSNVVKAAANGDYSKDVTDNSCHGEYEELMDHVNALVGSLRIAAAEAPTSASRTTAPPRGVTPETQTLAIMFVDIDGFTARAASMSRAQVINLLRRARAVIDELVPRRGGRVVKSFGDGFLATFTSPTEAVLTGTELLAAVAHRNGDVAEAHRLQFRVGVATGEVTVERDDVVGDAVNLASRLQQLATGADVFVSESTYHAMNRAEVALRDAGEFAIKGINQPVRVYRAAAAPAADTST